ncbi:MAG: ABC transporter permease [Nanoarchaeota archaeon]
MILDYFKLAVKNIRKRKLRSWLTMAGIFISIATVFVLISLSLGLQIAVTKQFEQLGTDKFFVFPSALILAGPGAAKDSAMFSLSDVNVVEKVQGVKDLTYFVIGNSEVKKGETKRFLQVVGIPTDKLEIFSETDQYIPEQGKFLKSGDTGKVILGNSFSTGSLYKNPIRVGDMIEIDNQQFKVVGILKKVGNSGDDQAVYISFEDAKELFNSGERVDEIMVQVGEESNIKDVADRVQKDLLEHRGLKEKNKDFSVTTPEELLASFDSILNIIMGFLLGIAAISLLVGGIGIANTMYASVLERTKEIGTMKAIGAQNKDILLIFLIESGLLGIMGGIIGVLFGFGVSKSIEYIATNQLGTNLLQAAAPFYLIIGCLIFAFLAGAVSGIWPAYKASKLNTVDALRYE